MQSSGEGTLRDSRKKGAKIIGLVMVTPKKICKERNRNRERTVPDEVIENMDEQSRSIKHTINTELGLFDEVRIIDGAEKLK